MTSVPAEIRTVLITAPDPSTGESLARSLVEERLAACANVVPGVVSVFRWEGRVQREEEVLLIVKTTAPRVPALRERVLELHPYEVPEILALPIVDCVGAYSDWVRAEVQA